MTLSTPLRAAAALGAAAAVTLAAAAHLLAVEPSEPVAVPAQEQVQRDPDVAFGDGRYLVAWQAGIGDEADIYGAFFDGDGAALSDAPIVLCSEAARQRRPVVAFSGGQFFVAWEDLRDVEEGYNIYGTSVGLDGAVAEPGGALVAGGPGNQAYPGLAGGDDLFLITYQEAIHTGYVPVALALGLDGAPAWGPVRLVEEPDAGNSVCPANRVRAAYHAAEQTFLVVWNGDWRRTINGDYKIAAARISASGEQLDDPGFDVSNPGQRIFWSAVTGSPAGWLVGWHDERDRGESGFAGFAARVSPSGEVLDQEDASLVFGDANRETMHTAVAFDGSRYVVAFVESLKPRTDVLEWRLVARSAETDGDTSGNDLIVAADAQTPALACDGAGACLLAYVQNPADDDGAMTVETMRLW